MQTVIRKTCLSLLLVIASGLMLGLHAQAAVTVAEGGIREAVIQHVMEKLENIMPADDLQYVTVDILRVPGSAVTFPEAKSMDDIHIHIKSRLDRTYAERAVVQVRLEGPNGRSREFGVSVRLLVRKPVWVVKKAVPARKTLKASDFVLETRDVSHGYVHMIDEQQNLNEYIARVNLRPGDVLDARKVSRPPDVQINHEVLIVLNQGGMTMTVPGIALANGRVGDTIRVRQAVFQKRYFEGEIIDKNRVLVEI